MPGTKPGIIYFESFIKKSLAEALTNRFQSASANEPSASRLCQSDGTLSQPAGRLAGMKNGDTVTVTLQPHSPLFEIRCRCCPSWQRDVAKLSARIH